MSVRRLSDHPRRFRWPKRLLPLLGRVPDAVAAARAGCSLTIACRERRSRGIPPFRPRRPAIQWTEEMLRLLGTDTDPNVAAELRIGTNSVSNKRRELGIPPFLPRRAGRIGFNWTPRAVNLLGRMPDAKVARRLGLSSTEVNRKRKQLGIPSFAPAVRRIEWTEEILSLLGLRPDKEIAQRFGLSPSAVQQKRGELGIELQGVGRRPIVRSARLVKLLRLPSRELVEKHGLSPSTASKLRHELRLPPPEDARNRRWTPPILARLGKEPDASIARELGVKLTAVWKRRTALGIKAWAPPSHRWTRARCALLGKISDSELGRRMGITPQAVRDKRRRLGIGLARRTDGARDADSVSAE